MQRPKLRKLFEAINLSNCYRPALFTDIWFPRRFDGILFRNWAFELDGGRSGHKNLWKWFPIEAALEDALRFFWGFFECFRALSGNGVFFFKDFGILQILGRCLRSVVACGAFSWRHGAGRGQCWKLVASTHDEAKGGTRPPNDKTKENERKGGNALRLKEWGARRGKKWCGWMSPYIVWQRHMTSQSPLGALYCTWRNHSVLSASWLATSLAVSRFNTAAGSAITSDIRSGAQGCRTRLG